MNKLRRYALPVVLWIYGIAVSVTLISVWGRAVVVDTGLMSAAAAEAASAGPVVDRIEAWLTGEIAERTGMEEGAAQRVVVAAMDDPFLEATFEELVGEVVVAAATPPGTEATVDVSSVLAPAVPALGQHLAAQGLPVGEEFLADQVAQLDPLVVRQPDEQPFVGSSSGAARGLYLATVIGLGVVWLTGAVALWLSDDRRATARSLVHRIVMAGVGFLVLFQLGSWILDPGAGRAPFREAASRLAGAKLYVPAAVAAVGLPAAWLLRTRPLPVLVPGRRAMAPSPGTRTSFSHHGEGPGGKAAHPHDHEQAGRDRQQPVDQARIETDLMT